MPDRGVPIVGDQNPLASRQSVVLDHVRRAELVQRVDHLAHVETQPRVRGRDAGRLHDLLGERLAAFQPSRLGGRAEDRYPARPDGIRHPDHQRRLRADHDERCTQFDGERGDGIPVQSIHRVVRPDQRSTRVAGRDVDRTHRGVTAQRPRQGVLAATGSNHQNGLRHPAILSAG